MQKEMTELISVIIPMYNTEKYIKDCLQSVLNQSYQKIEVIVVDDGSTDNSRKLCEEFRESDERMILISQNNKGVSAARNKAIDAAHGEYLFFMDSDDMIHPELLEEQYGVLKKYQADIAAMSYIKVDSNEIHNVLKFSAECHNTLKWELIDNNRVLRCFHDTAYIDVLAGIGGKLISRKKIGSHRFDEGIKLGEDTLYIYNLILDGIKIVYSYAGWYFYRMHDKNAIRMKYHIEKFPYYIETYRRIRDSECQAGRFDYAVIWERQYLEETKQLYVGFLFHKNCREKRKNLRNTAFQEIKHPAFGMMSTRRKCSYIICLLFPPIYYPLHLIIKFYKKVKVCLGGCNGTL